MAAKTYEVTGVQPVMDHAPGSRFQADLRPDQEAFLLQRGSLRVVQEPKRDNKKQEPQTKGKAGC